MTTFTVDEYAVLSDWMVGWMLQPDTSKQVFLPITDVNVSWGTVSVRGDYDTLADAGTSYRIFAPPGVETRGAAAGLLEERWVAGRSSRCLYAGYRYEAPLAGLPTWTGASPSAVARQTGKNFAGFAQRTNGHGASTDWPLRWRTGLIAFTARIRAPRLVVGCKRTRVR